jgi:serine/threonine protein phosphatase PrpC
MSMLSWSVAGATERGCHRKTNDDSFFISEDKRVLAVVDGGGIRGAEASAMTVAAIEGLWRERQPHASDIEQVKLWMVEALCRASQSVFLVNDRLFSTVAMAIPLSDGRIAIGHVGDSRAYRIRNGRAELLTQDHSLVNEMIRLGKLTLEQVRGTTCNRHILLRAIGHEETVNVEQQDLQLEPGDTILLCTDGLSYVLDNDDDDYGDIVACEQMNDPAAACENLLKSTIDGGAPDDVTVIAIRCLKQ